MRGLVLLLALSACGPDAYTNARKGVLIAAKAAVAAQDEWDEADIRHEKEILHAGIAAKTPADTIAKEIAAWREISAKVDLLWRAASKEIVIAKLVIAAAEAGKQALDLKMLVKPLILKAAMIRDILKVSGVKIPVELETLLNIVSIVTGVK